MENKGNLSSEETKIEKALGNFLQFKVAGNGLTAEGKHLDEDSLTAFVEGNLREKEAKPIVSHLVDCSFCRQVTAELVKLDFAFADENVETVAQRSEEPSPVSKVLNDVLARIFGSNEGVVFAHQEAEEETEENGEADEDKS